MVLSVIVFLLIAAAGGFLGSLLEFAGGSILLMVPIGGILGLIGIVGVRRGLDSRRRS